MNADQNVSTIVGLLKGVYDTQSNRDRRQITLNLLRFEEQLDGRTLVSVAVSLLGLSTEGSAVQAYGAVMLKNALRCNKASVTDIPFSDLFTWYCNEPSMSRLLAEDMRKLLVACVYSGGASVVPQMLQSLLADDDLSKHPRRLLLLNEVANACMDPDFDHVDRDKVGPLRRALVAKATHVLRCLTVTLFSLFTAAGGQATTTVPQDVVPLLDAAFAVMGVVAPAADCNVWNDVSLGDTLTALLRWPPSQRSAVMVSSALIRTANSANVSKMRFLEELLSLTLDCLRSCVVAKDIGVVDEVLSLVKDVPKSIGTAVAPSLCRCLVPVLTIPSVWFAEQVCSILTSVEDKNALKEINPYELYAALHNLIVKHQFDPENGSDPEGAALSQEQLGFTHLFKQTFDNLRSMAGKLMRTVAALDAQETNSYIVQLLTNLSDAKGTPSDPRTRNGYVTQRSATFLGWEATAFMVEHLTESFRHSTYQVAECTIALQQRRPSDAVLTPLYLNMLSCFWRCREATESLNLWSGTLDILFHYVEDQQPSNGDLDEEAAHRRAHTLLVTACSDHANEMGPNVVLGCLQRIKGILFSAKGQDRTLLYECLAALIAVLPPQVAPAEFSALVDPMLAVIRETTLPLTQETFNAVVVGKTQESRDLRDTLRTSIDILSAVFRRSQQTGYVMDRLNNLVPVLTHLVTLLHGVTPANLPPEFRRILELSDQEKQQLLPGRSRQSNAGERKSPAEMARLTFLNMRTSLYQLVGAVCPLVPTEHLSVLLQSVLVGTDTSLPISHVRTLTQKCLMVVADHHPSLLGPILGLLTSIFTQRTTDLRNAQAGAQQAPGGGRPSKRNGDDDVVDGKQWFYYTKDVVSYVRARVLENSMWRQNPQLLPLTASLAVSLLECNTDSRGAFYFAMALMDLSESTPGPSNSAQQGGFDGANAQGLGQALLDMQQKLYIHVLRFVAQEVRSCANGGTVSKEVDSLAYVSASAYVRLVPNLGTCLTEMGVPPTEVEKLHTQLIMANSEPARRRKVKDFYLSVMK